MDGDQGCIAVSPLPLGPVGGRQGNGGKRAGVKKNPASDLKIGAREAKVLIYRVERSV